MMNDSESWSDGAGLAGVPDHAALVDHYAAASGRDVTLDDVAWYRALSGYRFGVISCFNVMLHRSGSARIQNGIESRRAFRSCSAVPQNCLAARGLNRLAARLLRPLGRLAQLVERYVHTVEVIGSRPVSPHSQGTIFVPRPGSTVGT